MRHDTAPHPLPLKQAKIELTYWQHLSEISKSPVKLQRHQAKLAEKLARKKLDLTKARNLEHPQKLNEEILNLEKQVTDSKLAPDLIETFLHIAEANKIYSEYKTKKHP